MQSKTMRLDRIPPEAMEFATKILRDWTKTHGWHDQSNAWLVRDVIEHLMRPAKEQHASIAAAGLLIPPSRAKQKKQT